LESEDFVVTVTDVNGCQSTDTVFVEVLPDLDVTSGFTPNGDGVNDSWIIDNIELFPSMVVHVFNRWGVEVFESQGYNANIAWDGTYEGSFLPSGTYYFTIELNDARFPDPITGPLTLHR
jgi:gliding motility-associated-like protein